jgi:hypothetical protein
MEARIASQSKSQACKPLKNGRKSGRIGSVGKSLERVAGHPFFEFGLAAANQSLFPQFEQEFSDAMQMVIWQTVSLELADRDFQRFRAETRAEIPSLFAKRPRKPLNSRHYISDKNHIKQ